MRSSVFRITLYIKLVRYKNRFKLTNQLRPYTVKSTGTRPISEVKPLMAQSVLWLGTTWEYWTKEMQKSRRQKKLERKQLQCREAQATNYATKTPFRDAERNFKSRLPPPNFSNVFDFDNIEDCSAEIKNKIVQVDLSNDLDKEEYKKLFGQFDEIDEKRDLNRKKAYLIKDFPGFIFIRNPFTPEAQKYIIKRCLKDFAKYPNKSNLDTHYALPKEGIWKLHEKVYNGQLNENDSEFYVPLKAFVKEENTEQYNNDDVDESLNIQDNQDVNNQCNNHNNNNRCNNNNNNNNNQCNNNNNNLEKSEPSPSPTVPILSPSELMRKLRWITLGYQYHWPTKTYHLDRQLKFPQDIDNLTTAVVKVIDGIKLPDDDNFIHKYEVSKWKPEAGVINYYQLKDNLMAHVDKSEINMDSPLISFSFGHTCIFLIGGLTREVAPIAIYLRSGDISIMCGIRRACFHGVPRILEGTLPEYLKSNNLKEDSEWDIYANYMSTSRININVRQVF
ncbi:hypothetical protein Glove_186g49 [Diversispora epigaea]|uniref:Fe2OG dioxygenase domain-containing protein n=1 Tax=Diversispora epigaea TaxID=1348612 RepID=A0A397IRZ5_9GLOM|nr:hypothetical protein Glove_186g49 [Diversispora epigaea]